MLKVDPSCRSLAMRYCILLLVAMWLPIFASINAAYLCAQTVPAAVAQEPVFRDPFTLKLGIDEKHYYEQHFDKIPYVIDGSVYLFKGESFGINVVIDGDRITGIQYQPDAAKSDLSFRFTQEKSASGLMMLLTTQNKMKRKIFFNALMTVPRKEGVFKTSVLPIDAGLSNYESWPHPIVQLVLQDFRLSEK